MHTLSLHSLLAKVFDRKPVYWHESQHSEERFIVCEKGETSSSEIQSNIDCNSRELI